MDCNMLFDLKNLVRVQGKTSCFLIDMDAVFYITLYFILVLILNFYL
jgi:hypothetical protein